MAHGSTDPLSSRIFVATNAEPVDQTRLHRLEADGGKLRPLFDEMLKGICHWLRAAGYEVAIVDDSVDDDDLLARACAENRLLLMCDRRPATRRR